MITLSNQIEIRHLKYFLAVAEDLHFKKASERLFISQPALSRQVKQLEDILNTKLLDRNNRNVALTPAGEFLKENIEEQLGNLNELFRKTQLVGTGKFGSITLGYVGSAMQEIIPEMLVRFNKKNSDIRFNLIEMNNQKQIENILSKKVDLGFARLDFTPKGITTKPILKEKFCLVLPKNHHITKENLKSLEQLKDEPFILVNPKENYSYHEKIMKIFEESGFIPIISHNTMNASSIYRLVENNLGISIVPKSLTNKYNTKVKFIELDIVKQETTLSLLWKKDNKNPLLQDLIKEFV